MKTLVLAILFSGFYFTSSAQDITGLWYSPDSSRVYQVYKTDRGYQADQYTSKRTNDKPGVPVLRDVKYYQKKKDYEGIIHAADDGTATLVKIRMTMIAANSTLTTYRSQLYFEGRNFCPAHNKPVLMIQNIKVALLTTRKSLLILRKSFLPDSTAT